MTEGAVVLGRVLARVQSRAPVLNNHVCWVVSIAPPGGVILTGGQIIHLKYDLVFVDAQTGRVLLNVTGGIPTPQKSG
jgi:hypothetical protein